MTDPALEGLLQQLRDIQEPPIPGFWASRNRLVDRRYLAFDCNIDFGGTCNSALAAS